MLVYVNPLVAASNADQSVSELQVGGAKLMNGPIIPLLI